jgi:ribosome-associated protein
MAIDFKKLAQAALHAAEEKKGLHPLVLDLRQSSDVADYMLIVTAESSAQMRAISDGIEDDLKSSGAHLLRREGKPGSRWLAIDYGGLVVHILMPDAREFYRLEQMWEEARPGASKARAHKTKKTKKRA